MGKLYTEQAERVLEYAKQAASHLAHGYIGSEHLFLGLIKEGTGVAAKALSEQGVTV